MKGWLIPATQLAQLAGKGSNNLRPGTWIELEPSRSLYPTWEWRAQVPTSFSCVPSKYIHVIVFFVFKGKRLWLRAFPCITKPKPTSYRGLQFDTVQRNVLWFYGRSHCVHPLAHQHVFLTSMWTTRSQHVHPIKLQHALLRYLDMLLTFYQNSVKKL